jgi:Flp pilus assembly protein TadD
MGSALNSPYKKEMNDLGYSLLQAGKLDEAEEVLQKSILLAPPDYEFSRNNLSELKEKRKETKAET